MFLAVHLSQALCLFSAGVCEAYLTSSCDSVSIHANREHYLLISFSKSSSHAPHVQPDIHADMSVASCIQPAVHAVVV